MLRPSSNTASQKADPKAQLFNQLFRRFDKGLSATIDHLTKSLNVAVEKVEKKLKKCEKSLYKYIKITKSRCMDDINLAEVLVNKELRSKIIMSQWTNKFLSITNDETLDPVTFAFSRFSLNICLSYNDVSPTYLITSGIHKQLVDYISLSSELVIGPSVMALVHVSLHQLLKPAIVLAGALSPMVKLMVQCKSKLILAQCCKLAASLALHQPNKPLMANSGCMHALFDFIVGVHVDVDRHIQYSTLCAILNVIYMSDANRMLAVELNGLRPLLTLLRSASEDVLIVQAIKVLANIAYNSGYTANCVLVAGGGEVLVEILESCDILRQPLTVYAVLAAFSNISNNEVNQTHIGSIKGLVECVIRICDFAREPYLVAEAANFLLSCVWNSTINKARVANKGGCSVMVKRILKHAIVQNEENLLCVDRLSMALSSTLLHEANHEKMIIINALDDLVRLCKASSDAVILSSVSKVICTMVPSPEDLYRFHKDSNQFPIEKVNALPVLKKAKFKGFGHLTSVPDWLETSIKILSMPDSALKNEPPWTKSEFTDKLDFCKEFCVDIEPDSTVLQTREFRGLLFSIY